MTVTTTANVISYAGNGVTKLFAYPYIFFEPTDLVVTLFDTVANANLVPPPQLNGISTYGYTITGTTDAGEYPAGATITFNNAPTTGLTVTINRAVPALQEVALVDNTKFPAETVNVEFDKLTVLAQQTSYYSQISLRIPVGENSNVVAPVAAVRAGHLLAWEDDADFGISNKTTAEIEGAVDIVWSGVGTIDVGEAIVLPTLGALQGLTSRPPLAITEGHTVVGDRGGGVWVWDGTDYSGSVGEDPAHGLFAPPFTDTTGASGAWVRQFDGSVSPLWYGARGDGGADDTLALKRALESRYDVDGGEMLYGITSCQPTVLRSLRNANLISLTPGVGRMLWLENLSDFSITNIHIDMGDPLNVGTSADIMGLMLQTCSNFTIDGVKVSNGGPATGIGISGCSDFVMSGCRASDFRVDMGAGLDPQDDVIQLFWLNANTNFSVSDCHASRATVMLHDPVYRPPDYSNNPWLGNSHRWSRGFAFSGCSLFSVTGCAAIDVDQGFDLSGSDGNSAFVMTGNRARRCASIGFKYANSAFEGTVGDCHAGDCGLVSFGVAGGNGGSTEPGGHVVPLCQNISFSNCRAYNTGSDGKWAQTQVGGVPAPTAVRAYVVWMGGAPFDSWPRSVKFHGCQAIDAQAIPTTNIAFQCDFELAPQQPTNPGYDRDELNELIDCSSLGVGLFQQGFHFPYVALRGSGNQTITTGLDTVLVFDDELYDSASMHSISVQAEKIYIKKGGYYDISLAVTYPASPVGVRLIFIKINGVTDPVKAEIPGSTASHDTLNLAMTRYCNPHDAVEAWTSHTSDVNLDVALNRSSFSVALRR